MTKPEARADNIGSEGPLDPETVGGGYTERISAGVVFSRSSPAAECDAPDNLATPEGQTIEVSSNHRTQPTHGYLLPLAPQLVLPQPRPGESPSDQDIFEISLQPLRRYPDGFRRARAGTTAVDLSFPGVGNISGRRRRPLPGEETWEVIQPYPPTEEETPSQPSLWLHHFNLLSSFVEKVSHTLIALYTFTIVPSFLHDEDAPWDSERLQNRLDSLRGSVAAGNAGLFAAAGTLLAVPGLSNSSPSQALLIIAGIFGLFGFIFSTYLATQIGDRKTEFSAWFLNHENLMRRPRSSWSLSTMVCIPLTWMAWSVVSLLAFLGSLWIEVFIYDLKNSRSLGGAASDNSLSATAAQGLSFSQLAGFLVVTLWSMFYILKIFFEVRQFRASRTAAAPETQDF